MNSEIEKYFNKFRTHIIGIDSEFETAYGKQKMIYADWIASGRLYAPIEEKMSKVFGPMLGNTHSEASETGVAMTRAYEKAKEIIKKHVNASKDDYLIAAGAGMTRVVNKLQRILGLRLPDKNSFFSRVTGIDLSEPKIPEEDRPVVFVTHVEHHSNHFSWVETIADVIMIPHTAELLVDIDKLKELLEKYKDRKIKIGAFSAASNVTGYKPPIHQMAKIMHQHNGLCFIDFAASAPYVEINMHKNDSEGDYFDAIYFSPHKFLGGPGSAAVLVFNKSLYANIVPDHPGGGTVLWTNPWNEVGYTDNVELREDGGTPAFLQTIRTALAIKLKEQMGVENIEKREQELINIAFDELNKIQGVHILAKNVKNRLGVVSFYCERIHHNLLTKLLNDRFGIQVRGGCSCAGPYGHFLLHLDKNMSHMFTDKIMHGDASEKPGWVRVSLHPTMTNEELLYVINAIKQCNDNAEEWGKDYFQEKQTGEFFHKHYKFNNEKLEKWFESV
jgi:selenocysteine lyase/cysteine desulfurase